MYTTFWVFCCLRTCGAAALVCSFSFVGVQYLLNQALILFLVACPQADSVVGSRELQPFLLYLFYVLVHVMFLVGALHLSAVNTLNPQVYSPWRRGGNLNITLHLSSLCPLRGHFFLSHALSNPLAQL